MFSEKYLETMNYLPFIFDISSNHIRFFQNFIFKKKFKANSKKYCRNYYGVGKQGFLFRWLM